MGLGVGVGLGLGVGVRGRSRVCAACVASTAATSSSKPNECRSHCATKGPWPVALTLYISSTRVASAISSVGGRPEALEMLGAPL